MRQPAEQEQRKRLMLCSAIRGGFVVLTESYSINTDSQRFDPFGAGLLYAGSLADCLEFMGDTMRAAPAEAA